MNTYARSADERLALALKIDARISKFVRCTNRNEARIAVLLSAMDRGGLYLALGYESLNAYAFEATGLEPTKTSRMVTLVRRLADLPQMRGAFFSGEVPWTKACLAAEAAVTRPDGDAVWTQRLKELSRAKLKAAYHAETGVPVKRRIVLEVTEEEYAWIQDGLAGLRREHDEPIELSAATVEAFRRLVLGHGPEGALLDAGPRPLVTLGVCTECDKVTHNDAVVTDGATLAAACDAEVVQLPSGTEAANTTVAPPSSRTIPARVRKLVHARDGGRCRVPGCGNRAWGHLHHEGGWRRVGHDPECLVSIWTVHHAARHDELLKIVFDRGLAIFARADGVVLER